MTFAKLNGGSIAIYPYPEWQVRADHPGTSFPDDLALADLSDFGVVTVKASPAPEATATHIPVEGPPALVDGVWTQTWALQARPVPFSVTPLQIRKALRQVGLKAAVDSYLATLPEEVAEEWEYALEVRRDNPTLLAAADALGMTEAQADDLFRLAASMT